MIIDPSLLRSKSSRMRRMLVIAIIGANSACQFVFGDFEFVPDSAIGGATGVGGAPADHCGTADAKRCNTAIGQPQICRNGSWTNNGDPCAEPGLCNVTSGTCDVCHRGNWRCSPDKTRVETCNDSDSAWLTATICSTSQVCDSGRLACVACSRDKGLCKDSTSIYRCTNDLSGFETNPTSCSKGLPCISVDGRSDYCAECNPNVERTVCSKDPDTLKSYLQTCSDDQRWVPTECKNACVMLDTGDSVCQ